MPEARKALQTFVNIGREAYGEKRFSEILKRELDRRYKEIEITGRSQWCSYQRANLTSLGTNRVFDSEAHVMSDDIAMLLATLVVAQSSCQLKTASAPLNVAVARHGFDLVDFQPDGQVFEVR